jgi:hypothetical protein
MLLMDKLWIQKNVRGNQLLRRAVAILTTGI